MNPTIPSSPSASSPGQPPSASFSYLPRAAISARAAVWSLLAGLAFPLPAAGLIALLPLPHATAASATAAAARITQIFLRPAWIALLALGAFPLLEEIFYRGLLLSTFRRVVPLPFAVAIPTLFFAATHLGQGRNTALFALIAGGFFSWLVLRSRSLLPAMLCHSAVNLSWLFVFTPIFLSRGVVSPADFAQPLPLALCTGSLAVLVAAISILRRELRPRETPLASAPVTLTVPATAQLA